MASLVLSAAGAAAGGALLPGGVSFLGASLSGAALGQAVGAGLGALIDQQLFAPAGASSVIDSRQEGPRLSDLQVMASSEGASIPRAYGRTRLSGQIVWATDFEEEVVETVAESTATSSSSGGKGGGGGGGATTTTQRTTVIEYRYFANFALGLCEGPITRIGRIWADGRVMDLSDVTFRLHRGTETQMPDPLIEAVQGAGNVPGWRGLAYVVFERLPLARFGNRLPQLQVEIFRALNDVEPLVKAVTVIPGATEFGYRPGPVVKTFEGGITQPVNTNNVLGGTDWQVSMDQLQETCPALQRAGLVVTWFGDDLRAGHCTLRPKVERADTVTSPVAWSAAGLTRATAQTVSTVEGRPAFGGTPSDESVTTAIRDLAARGLGVTFYPFIMMDVPPGNLLPDPHGGASQPAYPWRGRITADPAPGQPGSPDGTAAARAQVEAFFGTAARTDFTLEGDQVIYAGPDEWSYRRQVLHYAWLCKAAGGVSAFLVGTELRGLTQVRDDQGYPVVAELAALAADVKAILGTATKVTYAADWSEYFGHQPTDGSGDVAFHLDPLWASPAIDMIGIDNYMPLSDWRDGLAHADALAGAASTHDVAYLKGNIAGGEGFDWFYASDAARTAQQRTPITDGAAGKPWVFRVKDLVSWWSNPHFDRPGGIEAATPTAWVPRSKPVWFTELGCPAVDRGANQPNVFFDPKSAESALPYFSRGMRDDLIQRQFLRAHLEYWDEAQPGFDAAANPVSSLYGGRMIDPASIHVWTWDARPWPAFPQATDQWSDGLNWRLGHWLTGRLGAVPLGLLVAHIVEEQGFSAFDVSGLSGIVEGFVIDRAMSARAALAPLMQAFFFEAVESEGVIRFAHRGAAPVAAAGEARMPVPSGSASAPFELIRGQETDLPSVSKLTYIEADADYRQAAVDARRRTVRSERVSGAALPIVLRQEDAVRIAQTGLQDAWIARERASFSLPPSMLALDPADLVDVDAGGRTRRLRITRISDGPSREAEAVAAEPAIFGALAAPARNLVPAASAARGAADLVFLDLPLLRGDEAPHAPFVAATASPWPGGLALHRSADGETFALDTVLPAPATMGVTEWDLHPGPVGRWDRGNTVRIRLFSGALQSASPIAVLGGANVAAIGSEKAGFEIVQFRTAELVASDTYDVSLFLRAQAGSEPEMAAPHPAGSRFVLLTGAVRQAALGASDRGLPFVWRYGPASAPLSDPAFVTRQATFAGIGLRPLSPVHLRAWRLAGGDIEIVWIRRTRVSGDSWEQLDVPLGEETERYALDILDGGSAVRTLETLTPRAIYAAADQLADFGALPATLTLAVHQVSAVFGRGAARKVTLNV